MILKIKDKLLTVPILNRNIIMIAPEESPWVKVSELIFENVIPTPCG